MRLYTNTQISKMSREDIITLVSKVAAPCAIPEFESKNLQGMQMLMRVCQCNRALWMWSDFTTVVQSHKLRDLGDIQNMATCACGTCPIVLVWLPVIADFRVISLTYISSQQRLRGNLKFSSIFRYVFSKVTFSLKDLVLYFLIY